MKPDQLKDCLKKPMPDQLGQYAGSQIPNWLKKPTTGSAKRFGRPLGPIFLCLIIGIF